MLYRWAILIYKILDNCSVYYSFADWCSFVYTVLFLGSQSLSREQGQSSVCRFANELSSYLNSGVASQIRTGGFTDLQSVALGHSATATLNLGPGLLYTIRAAVLVIRRLLRCWLATVSNFALYVPIFPQSLGRHRNFLHPFCLQVRITGRTCMFPHRSLVQQTILLIYVGSAVRVLYYSDPHSVPWSIVLDQWLLPISEYWCGWRDSNPHTITIPVPKTGASTNSATSAK